MCLTTMRKREIVNPEKLRVGYKVFVESQMPSRVVGLYSSWHRMNGRTRAVGYYKVGYWLEAIPPLLGAHVLYTNIGGIPYGYGFHILRTRKAAQMYLAGVPTSVRLTLRKVSYKNVVAIGTQNGLLCVVAHDMLIHDK